jgi:hypothetical protein
MPSTLSYDRHHRWLLPYRLSARRRRLFLREARAASALNDSHIITIYDILNHEGTDVLVMERPRCR